MKRRGFIGSLIAAATAPFVAKKALVGMAFHRDAFRVFADPTGVSTRMVSQYDASRDIMVTRMDVLYGIALDTSNPAHFVRIEA